MTLGERIYCMRKEKGLSQEQISNQLEVSRQSISKWELDQTTPEIDNLIKLSEIFNVSIDVLIKGETSSTKESYATTDMPVKEASTFDKVSHWFKGNWYYSGYILILWAIKDIIQLALAMFFIFGLMDSFLPDTSSAFSQMETMINSFGDAHFSDSGFPSLMEQQPMDMSIDKGIFIVPMLLAGLYASLKFGLGFYILRRKKYAKAS